MRYVKVVFVRRVGAFVGSDGRIYGPYEPGDEDVIPEDDAEKLSLEGAAARIGGYTVDRGLPVKPKPLSERGRSFFTPFKMLVLGFALVVVGFVIMALSVPVGHGVVWIFPLPPIALEGLELLLALLPVVLIVVILIIILYMLRG